MQLQTVLIKPSSSQCNMHCDYCFYCDESSKREYASYGMMSEEVLREVIKKTLFCATLDVCFMFQGGEPTLRGLNFFEKVIEYEEKFNRNNVRVFNSIQTNGLQINEKWCEFFKRYNFLVGVSLDGTRETHDACRHTPDGKPTYDRICWSLKFLEEYGIDYNILTVVNSYTAPKIREIYQEYKKNGWKYQQYITCLEPLGEKERKNIYSLTAEMYGKFLTELFNLWYKDWKRGKAPYIRQFENYIAILMGLLPESCEQRGVCSMQGVIEADGSVYPCDFYVLDEYRVGNFNHDSIDDFFENENAKRFIEESKKLSPKCKECSYFKLCRGACRRSRVKEKSDTYINYYCEGYKYFFDQTIDRLQEIAKYFGN